MTGIPPEVMTHKLIEDPSYPPVKQKKRKQGTFKNQVIQDEVQKLLKIGSIREVKYPNWLANTVVVPKKNGYNQIKMDLIDEEQTSFITDRGTYCYKVMPFGLKNAGATYQRLVTKMFQEHLGKTMEVYIDDMLVTTQHSGDHISHSSDAFQILQKFNMKLNPEKCAFGVASALKKQDHFEWNEECQQALKNLKTYLSNPPLLAKPKVGERLLIYLVVSEVAVMLIPRDETVEADALANLASAADVASNENASVIHLFHSVLDPDKNENSIIPEDKRKAHALRKKAARYCLKQGNLYQKMFGGPLARCIGPSQTEYTYRVATSGHCTVVVYEMGDGYRGSTTTSKRTGAFKQMHEKDVKEFIWWNIICRFGVPKEIIKRITSTPYHPVGNGQAESTNKIIINNLKKSLEESKVEIGEPSTRFTHASEESNNKEMRINLDLLEGKREVALIRMAAQMHVIERYYNRKARLRFFKIGDFVLKKVFQSMKAANAAKLSPTWEGSYRIRDIAGKGAYELETMDGKILPSY
ncbi:uncharacterized protein [Nicotiana sylvestris]|uniref:uncharacterized protein n=1 Tax=Nicotiana sylvestris TaxID=4096 RepID=UPI00388CAB47